MSFLSYGDTLVTCLVDTTSERRQGRPKTTVYLIPTLLVYIAYWPGFRVVHIGVWMQWCGRAANWVQWWYANTGPVACGLVLSCCCLLGRPTGSFDEWWFLLVSLSLSLSVWITYTFFARIHSPLLTLMLIWCFWVVFYLIVNNWWVCWLTDQANSSAREFIYVHKDRSV